MMMGRKRRSAAASSDSATPVPSSIRVSGADQQDSVLDDEADEQNEAHER